mgnify:CR=1 FL=1
MKGLDRGHYGLLARFDSSEALLAAARSVRGAGYHRLEAHAPFPVPGLAEALQFREVGVRRISLAAGLVTAGFAYLLQWYTAVIDYPIVVGGKPLDSWPAFLPITFAVGIFNAVMGAAITMLVKNRLPHFYHPVFNCDDFADASADGFFLSVRGGEADQVEALLRDCGARSVWELVL